MEMLYFVETNKTQDIGLARRFQAAKGPRLTLHGLLHVSTSFPLAWPSVEERT